MYNKLINREYNTILTLLDELYYSETDVVSIATFVEKFKLNRKTIIRIFESFNVVCVENGWSEYVEVTVTAQGIEAHFSGRYHPNRFYAYYLKNSIGYLLLDDLLNRRFVTIQAFADKYHISVATVMRKLKELRELLDEYEIKLNLKQKDPLVGQEYQIRFFYLSLYWQAYEEGNWPFKGISEVKVDKLVNVLTQEAPDLTYPATRRLKLLLGIVFTRLKQKKPLTYLNEFFEIPDNMLFSKILFQQKLPDFLPKYQMKDTVIDWELEVSFIYFLASVLETYSLEDCIRKNWLSELLGKKLCPVSIRWIELFCEQFEITLNQLDYVYLLVNLTYLHSRSLALKGQFHTFGKGNAKEVFIPTIPHLYEKIMDLMSVFIEENEMAANSVKNNPDFLRDYAVLIRPILESHQKPLRMLAYSKISQVNRQWIELSVKKNIHLPIVFVASLQEHPQMIISDFPLEEQICEEYEVFYIKPIQSPRDWNRLNEFILELSDNQNQKQHVEG